jgi:two-component system response regulator AtoC
MMQRGQFREDLYYRLKVIETTVPPLRERRDEILPLTDFFIAKYSGRYSRPARLRSPAVRRLFQAYDWPGNIRELENMIKHIARDASRVAERVAILDTLRQVRWNRRQAAQILGVCYKTLLNKIKEAGIERPQ